MKKTFKWLLKITACLSINLINAQTVDLTTHLVSATPPSGATLEWHNALPIGAGNVVATPTAVGQGVYYGVYNFGTCYSSPSPIRVATNACPATTLDLSTLVDSTNKPAGTMVTYHSAYPVSAANRLTNATVSTANTYFTAYMDLTSACFSESSPIVFFSSSCCANPSIGGTAAYAGGTMCSTSNAGTAMLSSNTGSIVRWETSTNSGSTWSPLTSTATYYNFTNAANAQQYRVVVNNGSGCADAYSAPATIATSLANCTSASCDNTTGNVTINVTTPPSLSTYSSKLIMTNASGVIQYVSAPSSTTINGVAIGDYLVYRVVYDSTQLPLPTLTVGTNITAIGGACSKFTNQLAYKVCPCPSGTTAPSVSATTLTNNCPATTANLGSITAANKPSGTVISWHTATPATAINKVADSSVVAAGTYYATFRDPATNCLSNGGAATTAVTVTITGCTGAPDLTTTIGQPTTPLTVGQPSNIPVTVANIGGGSAAGPITTTITLPTGVTAPATFTTNGWTCSTTTPSVTCTNPSSMAAGGSSTFNVPVTPNASTSGTSPVFNATTTPVSGETNTANNTAVPMTSSMPIIGGSLLSIKVLLQGNYDPTTGMMHDSLRKKGLIPLSDPYRTAAYSNRFTHKKNGATQTTTSGILAVTGANAIVDWVFIELHDAANPTTVVATMSALLQRDGDIVKASDGVSPVYLDSITGGNYYVAIRHRNHLGAMTSTTRSLSATSTLVDFTTLSAAQLWNKANGDGYEMTKAGVRNLLWAGDTDGNRQTVFSGPTNDVDPVFFDVMTNVGNVNFVPNYILNSQYLASDVNMDGKVIFQSGDNEVDVILFMILSHALNTNYLPSYIIVEQLP